MPEDDIETQELREKLDENAERIAEAAEKAAQPRWMTYLSLSTAIIAVFAAIASLESGSLVNEALIEKNDGVLKQSKASDQWGYFQAKGMKALVLSTESRAQASLNPELSKQLADESVRQQSERETIERNARELEHSVEEANGAALFLLGHHHRFALSVTVFQISIALSAIAALTRKKLLFSTALAASVVGVGIFTWAFTG